MFTFDLLHVFGLFMNFQNHLKFKGYFPLLYFFYFNKHTIFGCLTLNNLKKFTNLYIPLKKPLIHQLDTLGVVWIQLLYHLDTGDHCVKADLKLEQEVQI